MNRIGLRVTRSNVQQILGKLRRGAVVRHLGEMPARLGLDTAEHISRSATTIFTIPTGYPSRLHGYRRPNLLMEYHRVLVDTDPRFPHRERLFIRGQHLP